MDENCSNCGWDHVSPSPDQNDSKKIQHCLSYFRDDQSVTGAYRLFARAILVVFKELAQLRESVGLTPRRIN